ncbi:ribosomal RNA processing protein 1 homolog B [Stegastes partitus]|uniref:Ribosomal RNA processing 1 n=1 Tax=Stegastes partitus TaxID=144197 RepID=A0A3B4ZDK5_9TELE|nr:PREDICTED: ribosomal RNA processing protein 1 homolog A [Stegastes partitus]
MASIEEPEIQFAQRLASNERPIRTKALKKLRKYINARSQRAAGGFTGDELLKLWKGLFYCLWMQDKPLLQEELSKQISNLIHSFGDTDKQLLYLESFLLTFKREWTGIDRLRMDKFFQLVRFVFRQTFEALKRKNWESSAVSKFLDMLTAQLLQSSSEAPCGLQLHILDLYMTELATVGSAELTADQNLTFIEPFCKTAAKTKNQTLFSAICRSIFSTIIDQAPFAIEDLMKEMKAAEASDSDSGQASDEDENQRKSKTSTKLASKKGGGKHISGSKSNEEEEDDDDDDDDDGDYLEDLDTDLPSDDIGPVLQFDYAALADNLFELAKRNSTPGQNRQRLYRIIKVLRDLSEGIFPESEYPEEVSTDEDDEMFGSRKRMKRRRGHNEDNEAPAAKKSKGKKKEALNNQDKDREHIDGTVEDEKQNNMKANAQIPEKGEIVAQVQHKIKETKEDLECSQVAHTQSYTSSVKVTETNTQNGLSETGTTGCSGQSKKKKKGGSSGDTETVEEQESFTTAKPETSCDVPVSGKKKTKKKKKGLKAKVEKDRTEGDREIPPVSCEETTTLLSKDATTPAKKKNKGLKAKRKPEGTLSSETDVTSVGCEGSAEDDTTTGLKKLTDSAAPAKKRGKKRSLKLEKAQKLEANTQEVEAGCTEAEITSESSQHTTVVPLKKMTKKKGKREVKMDQTLEEQSAADGSTVTQLKKLKKQSQKELKTAVEEEGAVSESPQVVDAEKLLFEMNMTTPTNKKKIPNLAAAQLNEIKRSVDADLPNDETKLVSSSGKSTKKKRKIPVVFEFEAEELEAAALINGVAGEETVAKKTTPGNDVDEASMPVSSKKSQKKARAGQGSALDFITFQSKAAVPMPLFCKTKGKSSPLPSSKKKIRTPNSESKKVTFGLKNNKTAEFRKTDRSLLVSPDGSSRVPFDPQQKPKFGVLKSPPTPLSSSLKKTRKSNKTSSNSPKSTPKRRPSAADFF